MKKLQLKIMMTLAEAGPKAMVQDALSVIHKMLGKNEPKIMAKGAKKPKVSKRLQKQVKATIAKKAAKSL